MKTTAGHSDVSTKRPLRTDRSRGIAVDSVLESFKGTRLATGPSHTSDSKTHHERNLCSSLLSVVIICHHSTRKLTQSTIILISISLNRLD